MQGRNSHIKIDPHVTLALVIKTQEWVESTPSSVILTTAEILLGFSRQIHNFCSSK